MKDMNMALLASAEGDWTKADNMLRKILKEDAENFVVCVEKRPWAKSYSDLWGL
jgi:uncharacterized protein HemY